MSKKIRIDILLSELGLAPSRERAQAYVMAGKVMIDNQKIEKPGHKVPKDSNIRLLGEDQPYISRGGLKLENAIEAFGINPENRIAMDIGASTGGFTDCLLKHQASYVFAIDSGNNQLAWKLANHPRVKSLEKSNFRHLTMHAIGTFVDLIVIDVSFISLTKLLQNSWSFLVKDGNLVALIKPQFEAGRAHIKKGGLVDDPEIHQQVIQSIKTFAASIGFVTQQVTSSPIQGKKSRNREFLIHLKKP